MSRRGQTTVLALALMIPASAIGMTGLACLGARVQAERAQRLADVAALRAALNLPVEADMEGEITLLRHGDDWVATARLRPLRVQLPLVGAVAYAARASAAARAVATADGAPGAVLVG